MSGSGKPKVQRRLAAVLAADVVGFSTLMGEDEEGTLAQVKSLRREIIEPGAVEHHGRIVKTTGDGFLVEFSSPTEAVQCAVEMLEALASRAADKSAHPLQLRIGINLGEIIFEEDGDIYGDGVNIAARLEQLAHPGAICISAKVYEEVRDKLPYSFQDQGEQPVKNITKPLRVYSLFGNGVAATQARLTVPDRPSIAVLPFDFMSESHDGEFLADGLSEDIIAALSRIRSFFVIARNSTFTYKGRAVNVQQVSRDLGVRYVLEGSVRRSRDKVRITAQLIDATTGAHLWADRYDGTVEDIFDLQSGQPRSSGRAASGRTVSMRTIWSCRPCPMSGPWMPLPMRLPPGCSMRHSGWTPRIRWPCPLPPGVADNGSSTTGQRLLRVTDVMRWRKRS
jgi:adenylate cyclase